MFKKILGDMYENDFSFYEKLKKDPKMEKIPEEKTV